MAKPRNRKHQDQTKFAETQIPMFTPESDWRPPSLGDLPEWPKSRTARVGIDIETCDPDLKKLGCGARRDGSYVVGYSFSIEDGPSHYIPLRHQGGDNVEDVGKALAYLECQARSFSGILAGCNLGYDTDFLAEEGIDFIDSGCQWRDIGIADPLINELHMSYSLQAIAERFNRPGKSEDLLEEAARHFEVHKKGGIHKLPARFVGPYATVDSSEPLAILRLQERRIDDEDLWNIFRLECEVQPILVLMRRRGVRIDQDKLAEIEKWSLSEEKKALDEVDRLTGVKVGVGNVWQAKAVAPALEAIGVVLGQTSKGQPNIDKELFSRIDHPVSDALAWARKVNKLRTTFAKSVKTHMVNGRIHTTFNQLRNNDEDEDDGSGARYGRLSSEKPNLQQQPSRDEFAPMWRSIYLPEDGMTWGSLDYSQQEPRILMHYAEAAKLSKKANQAAFEAAEAYRRDPTTDNHKMMARMTGLKRTPAKAVFLGKVYGMGGAKLCRELDLPTRWCVFGKEYDDRRYFKIEDRMEARAYAAETEGRLFEVAGEQGQEILDTFDEKLPFVKELAKMCRDRAKKRGYVTTLLGRRCRFPMAPHGEYDWIHKSLNRVIQGGAADQTKKALVLCHREGHFLQIQIHDEFGGSFYGQGDARECAQTMSTAIPNLSVPFKVDIDMGPSWGEAVDIDKVEE